MPKQEVCGTTRESRTGGGLPKQEVCGTTRESRTGGVYEAGEGKRRGMGRLAVLPARAGPEGVYGARNVTAKVDK